MRFKNERYILSIFLTALMVFGTHISGYADENSAPVFSEDESTTRSVAENTAAGKNIGTAFTATDADDNDTLTYTLSGTDAASFSIVSTSGQLQTSTALDFETKSSYSVTVSVSDGNGGSDAIDVTIGVTNVNEPPRFPTIRASLVIPENAAPGTNIGAPFTATDPDIGDTLTYSLRRGDREAFQVDPNTGQVQTKAPLDYETKRSYTDLAVRATDSSGAIDAVIVTINVTDVDEIDEIDENRAPSFAEGTSTTLTVAENTASGQNIGSAVSASDPDDDTLTYTLGGADAESFSIVSTSGQLQTSSALDFEAKSSYSVTVSVSDGNGGSNAIDVTIGVSNVNEPPRFPTIRARFAIAENAAPGTNIGGRLTATDPDIGDTLTYSLQRGDRKVFQINPNTGQMQTKAPLDYETKRSYTDLAVRATDSSGAIDAVIVTINVTDVEENRAPSFAEGTSTTRAVAENTGSGQDIGSAVSATDPDNDTLTYTIDGVDAASFSINGTNGQLQTKAALDYETKTAYAVTVFVFDGNGASDSIDVTINITEINENRAPVFTDGGSTTRTVAENTASRQNIGSAVSATDPDNDKLTYTLGGTDAAAFRINTNNGQLKTRSALDYETKSSYTVTITVSDSELTDTIDVTINVTDVDENRAPSFTEGNRATRSVAENTGSGVNIGSAVSATDPDDDTLTYTLGGTDAASFSIDDTNGQLQTKAALDYETKTSYSVSFCL